MSLFNSSNRFTIKFCNNSSCDSYNFNLKFLFSLLIVILSIFFGLVQYYLSSFNCSNLKSNYNVKKIAESRQLPNGSVEYFFAIISDLDHNSKVLDKKYTWQSFLHQGKIIIDVNCLNAQVIWSQNRQQLQSQISAGDRAMELSDLVYYNGKILSIDDRTGIIYQIVDFKHVIPWVDIFIVKIN